MDVFTKKPVDIEACEFKDWASFLKIARWADNVYFVPEGYEHALRTENEFDRSNGHVLDNAKPFMVIRTLEGDMRASVGDMIIKGVQGEFYPCKPQIFWETYDAKKEA